MEDIISSMETTYPRWVPWVTIVAPVAWGSTYAVTTAWLPPDRPLFSAVVRALPIGLLIVVLTRSLPRGRWWWRALLLGGINIALFFGLLFAAAYRLPSGLAASITALSPLAVMSVAYLILGERAGRRRVLAGVVGVSGVLVLVWRVPGGVDVWGVGAAVGAVVASALGFVLLKRWASPAGLLATTGWQLVAGGLMLLPFAWWVEGAPPTINAAAAWAYVYLGVIGTGVAYVCWFTGLTRMPAGSTALLGLVNPVVGTVLGVAFLAESFGPITLGGMILALGGAVAGQPSGVLRGWAQRRGATSQPVAPGRASTQQC